MNAVRYSLAAALLGLGWFPVLLAPPWTRAWLLDNRGMVVAHAALLAAAGVIVAWAFRGVIASATGPLQQWARAALLPYAGAVVYLTLWNARNAAIDAAHGHGFNVHDALVVYVWAAWSITAACFVVVPYGFVCQRVMQRLSQDPPGSVPPRDTRAA